MSKETISMKEAVAEAIIRAGCPGREGPFGGYDYGYENDSPPKGGRYVIRDFREIGSPDFGKWLHQTDDPAVHEAMLEKMTREHIATAAIKAMREPVEDQWGELARQIIFWMDMQPKTPRALFQHLERSGREIPQWLRDEPEMKRLDHVPSKGTRAVLVYRAMIDAALSQE